MSNSFSDYWDGRAKAVLTPNLITVGWGHGENSDVQRQFVNRAFEIYYESRNRINRCDNQAHRRLMLESLEDSATDGSGLWGVNDLKEAFEHLADNNGRWTDSSTDSWSGGRYSIFQWTLLTAPSSIVAFMQSVNEKVTKLREITEEYNSHGQTLEQALSNSQWSRLGNILETINTWGGKAKPFLWWASDVRDHLSGILSYTSTLADIHTGLTEYTTLTARRGLSPDQALASMAFKRAIGAVPILGKFYEKAFELAPNIRDWFIELQRGYQGRIEQQMNLRWR